MSDREKIIKNQIKCKLCGDLVVSTYRHHFATCSCGKVSADGGTDYLRRVGDMKYWEEKSIIDSPDELSSLKHPQDKDPLDEVIEKIKNM